MKFLVTCSVVIEVDNKEAASRVMHSMINTVTDGPLGSPVSSVGGSYMLEDIDDDNVTLESGSF